VILVNDDSSQLPEAKPPVEDPFRKVNRTVASGASDRLHFVDETTLF
jgi:hypothetical protein